MPHCSELRHRLCRPVVGALALVLLTAASAGAADRDIVASRADSPPVIDGRLDDACWLGAEPSGDFFLRQGVGDLPSQKTEVRVCYDASNLYVGFECFENRMDELSAAIAIRDAGDLTEDDCVVLSVDTFRDGRSCYVFALSALGTERDFHSSECGRSTDVGWDAVWSSATSRGADRWCAELAIPFNAVRYEPAENMVWGVDFRRFERPHSEFSSWSNPDGFVLDPSRYGVLSGLSGIRRSVGLELKPFGVAEYDVSDAHDYPLEPAGSDWDIHPDAGLDVKYAPAPSVTVNLTLNPDFAQIEADPNEINLSGDELWLEERRPFFSENADIFHMPLSLFYTRRMEDIVYGGKATGKIGGMSFAGLYVRSDDLPRDEDGIALTDSLGQTLPVERHDYGTVILKQDLFGNATVGALVATREREDGYNRAGALTAGLDLFEGFRLTGLAARTRESGESPTEGDAVTVSWSYGIPNWHSDGQLNWIEENFNSETGYVPVDWRGRFGGRGHLWRRLEIEDAAIDQFDVCGWGGDTRRSTVSSRSTGTAGRRRCGS